jgi:hypothetical protein
MSKKHRPAVDLMAFKCRTLKVNLLVSWVGVRPSRSTVFHWVVFIRILFSFPLQGRFIDECQWSAHEEALALCSNQRLHQTVYFLNRDLTFMREVIVCYLFWYHMFFFLLLFVSMYVLFLLCELYIQEGTCSVQYRTVEDTNFIVSPCILIHWMLHTN